MAAIDRYWQVAARTLAASLLAALAMASAPRAAMAAADANPFGVAVIIGNKTYAGGVPAVDYADRDAGDMKRFVVDVLGYREGNVIDLRDASLAELVAVFGNDKTHKGKLFNWVRAGKSDVVVFYSGHGAPGLKDRRGYLLPVDADPNLAEITGYSVDLLYRNLSRIGARSVTLYIDACFTGNSPGGRLIRAASGISVKPALPAAAGLTVLTAAEGDQLASWDDEARNGLFTAYLLKALYGAADRTPYGDGDGKVTAAEAKAYLDDEMSYQARRRFGREQTASLTGDGAAVLATVPPGGAAPRPDLAAGGESGAREAVRLPAKGEIAPIDRRYVAVAGANVRARPSVKSRKVASLAANAAVTVNGRVKDRDWYLVERDGAILGYVFAPLLAPQERVVRRPAPAAGPPPLPTPVPAAAVGPWTPPGKLYAYAHTLIKKERNFADAAKVFRAFLSAYPDHALAPKAQYWLGRTFFVRGNFKRAARIFARGARTYRASPTAPNLVLNHGLALARLGKRARACATFARLLRDYPDAGASVMRRTLRVQARLRCGAVALANGGRRAAKLDSFDRVYARRATQRALEYNVAGQSLSWANADSGNSGTVTPLRTYRTAQGRPCREFRQTVTVGGSTRKRLGNACRGPAGRWRIAW